MRRAVARGDYVTWGAGRYGYLVLRVEELGLILLDHSDQKPARSPWRENFRFLNGDLVDVAASVASRSS